jgi:hypothetical protein
MSLIFFPAKFVFKVAKNIFWLSSDKIGFCFVWEIPRFIGFFYVAKNVKFA